MTSRSSTKTAEAAPDRQRLKEAVWRIQFHAWAPRMAKFRSRMIESELALLAQAVGVEMLKDDDDD